MKRPRAFPPAAKRLLGCLGASLVLAMMFGQQEGSQTDYGYAITQSVLKPRVFVFLAVGALAFVAITFWPRIRPFLGRPGVWPLVAGAVTVLAAQVLLHWYDPLGDGKFSTVAAAVANSAGIAPLTAAFFAWLAWTQLAGLAVAGAATVALRLKPLAWTLAVLDVAAGVIAYLAHASVVQYAAGLDHSLGYGVAVVGYLAMAGAMVAVALSDVPVSRTREFLAQVLGWRPGLPLVVLGLVVGLLSFACATWFSPKNRNATLVDTHTLFQNSGLAPVAVQYLIWLGWTLLVVSVVAAGAGAYLRQRLLSWGGAVLGVVAVLLTVTTLYDISDLAARMGNFDGANGPWQNLGTGGWLACAAFFFVGAGGFVAATTGTALTGVSLRRWRNAAATDDVKTAPSAPVSGGVMSAPGATKTVALAAMAFALFYPPTATSFWQQVLVTEIGVYVLLAVGLNVVVGWAGLLDLGFIAFYAIGSYTTAYLVGSLPVKPPSWLHMTPLLAIPFAIVICLLAGFALGAPTLRLRGDYLAIVTLGFGEIIRIIAVNADNVTNGSRGPSPAVPHPVVHLGPIRITWGLNPLQYWYLLLVLVLIVVLLFHRLENSRLGRAWAAVREDEVAASATGINTTRVKLLAFAIGASTSGLGGVFFASQVGFFNPDNFVLNNSILVVAYVVFGGMGSLPGAMAGAALLTWLPEFLRDQVPGADRQMWIGAVILLMMIFRPQGLLPARRRAAELSGFHDVRAPSSEPRTVPAGEGLGVAAR